MRMRYVKNVLLLSGQGSHHFQMGRELYLHDPGFRASLRHFDEVVSGQCGESVLGELFAEHNAMEKPFDRLLHTHVAIFMVQYALARLLIEQGMRVDVVAGASLGAFAAAAIAGCVEPDAALLAVIEQARLIEAQAVAGCMIAVMAEPWRYFSDALHELCELGAVNFDGHSIISLPATHLEVVENHLRHSGVVYQRLPVKAAFHSRWIDTIRTPYQAYLRGLACGPCSIPMLCCVDGKPLHELPENYFWSVVRDPIHLPAAISRLESQDCCYIDVGPGGSMAAFVKRSLPKRSLSSVHHLMSPLGSDLHRLTALKAALSTAARSEHRKTSIVTPGGYLGTARSAYAMTPVAKAILFPGQGSQFKGMGRELFPLFPSLLQQASDILGYSLEELCLADPNGCLSQTQYTQPALYVVNAMHYLRKYRHTHGGTVPAHVDFFAGHSLGEYNALLAAGVFSFETGLRLVKKRGELMGVASGGGMAAVIGVPAKDVRAMLEEHGFGDVDVANFNAPKQTVIAGEKSVLAAAVECLAKRDLRCVMLNVSAAFHSRHMRPLQAQFAAFLGQFSFSAPQVPVIANATARPYDGAHIGKTLAMQIASPVQWVDSIRYLLGQGVVEFEELGAVVLTRMVTEIKASETPIFEEMPPPSGKDKPASVDSPMSPIVDEMAGDVGTPVPDAIRPRTHSASACIDATSLGSEVFRRRYGLKYAYSAGAMYRGVASADLVIRMGRAGFLSFFGAGGLSPAKIEANLVRIQNELAAGQPYGMNLLANYEYPELEAAVVDLYLKYGVRTLEAAAFMQMTPALLRYRLQGLRSGERNEVICDHRIIAKVSRPEVARAFMSPPPPESVQQLLERGLVTEQQAELAQRVPVSHDICVEADSGGHTDGGIAAVMLPPLLRMRDELQHAHGYAEPICMGLAGGIGSPEAAAAAFLLGADFVTTGSINQCTVEAGMSADGKSMLQEMDIQDTEYAPAGDMFEIGAQVQVMKKSVFFPARANKLLSLYRHYDSLDDIPPRTRKQLEDTFFKKSFGDIWGETAAYFRSIKLDHEVAKAEANPKHKMALVFRWYFAYSTRIAMEGKGDDRVNYQIHTGPALGSFNQWVKGTELEAWQQRHVDHIAVKLMDATAEHLTQSYARFLGR